MLEVIKLQDLIWINCVESDHSNDKCAIYVEKNEQSELIKPADQLWWQGGFAMWTPFGTPKGGKSGIDYDKQIRKIGFSGVRRPLEVKMV